MDGGKLSSVLVSNVLNEEKKLQPIALGRLGWSLLQIQKAIEVRRETISVYLRAGPGTSSSLRAPGYRPAGLHRGRSVGRLFSKNRMSFHVPTSLFHRNHEREALRLEDRVA